jgi:carboxyl-terminal processing protease
VGMENGFVRVVTPMDGTPAARAGIKPGDVIMKLDDKPVKGMSLSEAIDAMRGKPGSSIKLTILRAGENQPRDFNLTREVIQVASVRDRLLENGYGYIRIAQFQSGTGQEVRDALKKLEAKGKLRGLVLDLRNNPGGVLQSAVQVADAFIGNGLIVYTTGRLANADLRFSATTPDQTGGVPMVALVNEGTASASEIVAGALQDHKRAVIMGVRTFGKGSVQTILPLDNDKAIKLTTALYFTPNGRSIQAEGIVPDIWVDESRVTPVKANPFWIKEKDLPGHLSNGNGKKDADGSKEVAEAAHADKLASTDYQLNEALTLLKGLNILTPGKKQG